MYDIDDVDFEIVKDLEKDGRTFWGLKRNAV